MGKSALIVFVIIVFLLILSFIIWHFFFSIYEVKYVFNFDQKNIKPNAQYEIESYGINSFGQKLGWREVKNSVEILEGNQRVKEIKVVPHNKIIVFTNSISGKIVVKIKSDLSLNPTLFTFSVIE